MSKGLVGITFACTAAALAAVPVALAETRTLDPGVVVTPTTVPTPAEEVGSTISVITREEIERRQYRSVGEALQSLPSLSVVRSGRMGGLTSVFTRGANSNQTLVLIDGVKANDPSGPAGAMDFSFLTVTDVERIEVLYGSQGGVYGSDAIGGVVNIITKAGSGAPVVTGMLEGGSFGTFNQGAGVSGGLGQLGFRLDGLHTRQTGLSLADSRQTPPGMVEDDDTHDQYTVSSRLDYKATQDLTFMASMRHVEARNDLDVSQSAATSNIDARERTEATFLRGEGRLALFDGMAESRLGVSHTRYHRVTRDDPDVFLPFDSLTDVQSGQRTKFDLKTDVYALPLQVVTLGLETQEEAIQGSLASTSAFGPFNTLADASVNNDAIWLQDHVAIDDRYFFTLGGRLDDHEQFGRHFTWRAAPAYLHRETGTKLRGSYATGFKAPTLFQLYGNSFSAFGIFAANPNLQPETSKSFDVGVDQELFGNRAALGVTVFETIVRNLIQSNAAFTTNVNIGKVIHRGIELTGRAQITPRLEASAGYTYMRPYNATNDEANPLLRRPRHKATGEVAWRPRDDTKLGVNLVFNGVRQDIDVVAIPTARPNVPSYLLVNITAEHELTENFALFGRIENALDRTYQDPDGSVQPDIGFFAGGRVRF
jgi:vitamin B12 transporter